MYLIIKEKDRKVRIKYIIYMIDCLVLLALSGAYGSSVMLAWNYNIRIICNNTRKTEL